MPEYQALARKYRPQTFKSVCGQDALVTTLKNAIQLKRVSHAYLFCGPRGTGKTTLARLFAKAINCDNLSKECEPCNECSSCKEISSGSSLEVIEIDGASNRGIDDIRQINETVSYRTASGKYKIYIIDEVHMLTKEAFNALLKTLEEPPPKVKFFFATTEPHKVLPTILSRCQRFNLTRISQKEILKKLKFIASDMKIEAEEEALHIITNAADGGMRDAESILDQIITFSDNKVTAQSTTDILGVLPFQQLFDLDNAVEKCQCSFAFELADQIFSSGKDLLHCVDGFISHFRNILLIHISGIESPLLNIPESAKTNYKKAAQIYSKEQCLSLLDFLIKAQNKIKITPSKQIAIESILLQIIQVKQQVSIEQIIRKLSALEKNIQKKPTEQQSIKSVEKKLEQKIDNKVKQTTKTESENLMEIKKKQSQHDTLLQFASVELGGIIKRGKN